MLPQHRLLLTRLIRAGALPEEVLHPAQQPLLDAPDEALGQTVLLLQGQLAAVIRARGTTAKATNATVALGLQINPEDIPAGIDRKAYILARLAWGTGAGHFAAEVDWHDGTQVSVNASSVDVNAEFQQLLVPDANGVMVPGGAFPADNYRLAHVTAAIAWGTRPARAYATRTYPLVTIPGGERRRFIVPPFAFALQIYAGVDTVALTAGVTQVSFQGGPGPGVDDGVDSRFDGAVFATAAVVSADGVKFADSARFVEIFNLAGVSHTYCLVFALNV